MSTVTIRDLTRNASEVVSRVARTGRPALVTRRGKPVAAVVPIDPEALEDFILAHAPSFVRATRVADEALRNKKTRPANEVLDELE